MIFNFSSLIFIIQPDGGMTDENGQMAPRVTFAYTGISQLSYCINLLLYSNVRQRYCISRFQTDQRVYGLGVDWAF